jgi:hypothetical protein
MGLAMIMLLGSAAACGSDDDDTGGAGPTGTGGSGTGGSGGTTAGGSAAIDFRPDSQAICLTVLTLNCPNDQASTCVDLWNEKADFKAQSGCGVVEKELWDCLAARLASDFVCDGSTGTGTPKIDTCGTEQVSADSCNQ